MVLDPSLVANRRARSGGAIDRLTPRQREILGLVAQGYTNAAISEKLVVATKTVEKQLNLLYQELGVDRSTSRWRGVSRSIGSGCSATRRL